MLSKLFPEASENVEGRRGEGIGIGAVPADGAYIEGRRSDNAGYGS
jgi:hypothetical protein